MIQVYTGDGKGKTTAAFGLALRAAGRGLKVRIYQFLKGGASISGELMGLKLCALPIEWIRFPDQIPPLFHKGKHDETGLRKALQSALERVREDLREQTPDLVILDELNVALAQEWIPMGAVQSLLDSRPIGVEVVVTGRDAPQALLERADLVTEMRTVKHPYDKGVQARKGIEF
jgi:cob(I)alamin adenosyltransferase